MTDPSADAADAAPFDLRRHLAREVPVVERALRRVLSRWEDRFDAGLLDTIRHGVLGGGKRLRPVLCVAAREAVLGAGTSPDAAYDLAASVELIHAYSLMHDDLPCMDDAELRRGRSTTHRVHGEAATIRAGAALIPVAVHTAFEGARDLGCDEATAREVARTLCRASGADGMVGGQALDLLAEGRALGDEELRALHGMKTGALLTAALEMGGVAAGAEPRVRSELVRYGRAVGLAFQITDDVLDATQTEAALGKRPSDAALRKSTYVSLHGLDRARELAREQIAEATGALERAGVKAPALRGLARYVVERTR